jgi:hypothetical protein
MNVNAFQDKGANTDVDVIFDNYRLCLIRWPMLAITAGCVRNRISTPLRRVERMEVRVRNRYLVGDDCPTTNPNRVSAHEHGADQDRIVTDLYGAARLDIKRGPRINPNTIAQ